MGFFDKKTGKFLAPKRLMDRFGRVNTTKNFLSINETPLALERSLKATTILKHELPTDKYHLWNFRL